MGGEGTKKFCLITPDTGQNVGAEADALYEERERVKRTPKKYHRRLVGRPSCPLIKGRYGARGAG